MLKVRVFSASRLESKRSLTSDISNSEIDKIYSTALSSGATGGKLLGAGGGFFLFAVAPEKQGHLINALEPLFPLKFKLDFGGTRITYFDPMGV